MDMVCGTGVHMDTEHLIKADDQKSFLVLLMVLQIVIPQSFDMLNNLWSIFLVHCGNKLSASCYTQPEMLFSVHRVDMK